VVLPREYAAWLESRARDDVSAGGTLVATRAATATGAGGAVAADDAGDSGGGDGAVRGGVDGDDFASDDSDDIAGFRITSPLDGDRYQVPPGVDARYATISLRAAGARDPASVRWWVDGRAWRGSRLPLTLGEHLIRASTARGESAEARIVVE
jgi:hypothetical protein